MRFKRCTNVMLKLWHSHFAWLPVDVHGTWVWLEVVKRKGTHQFRNNPFRTFWTWEYMLPEEWGR